MTLQIRKHINQGKAVRLLRHKQKFLGNDGRMSLTDVSKDKTLVWLLRRTINLNRIKLNLFETRVRSTVEDCSLICSNRRECGRMANENVQHTFTKLSIGTLSSLNYNERLTALNLETVWIQLAKVYLVFFNSIITGKSCISARHFKSQTPHSLWKAELVNTTDAPSTSITENVIVDKYSSLWNSLH